MRKCVFSAVVLFLTNIAFGQFSTKQPFKWAFNMEKDKLVVSVDVPATHYLYKEHTSIKLSATGKPDLEPESTPTASVHNDPYSGKTDVYAGPGSFQWSYRINPSKEYTIKVSYQGCRDKSLNKAAVCFPPNEETFKTTPVATVKPQKPHPPLQKNLSIRPRNTREKPDKGYLSELIEEGGIWIFIAAFIAGILSTLTPCVLPLIPITVAVLGAGKKVEKKQAVIRSALYVLGIVITFTIAATIAAMSGQSLGANILGNPYVIGAFVLIFTFFGISMLGLYDLQLPQSIQQKLNQTGGGSTVGTLLMGVVAGFIAFPCTGPILAVLLGIVAISANPLFGVALLDFYADWCAPCKEMEMTTFTNAEVVNELTENWVLVKVDGTISTEHVKKMEKQYGVTGFPSLVILDLNGEKQAIITGYQSPLQLLEFLKEHHQ